VHNGLIKFRKVKGATGNLFMLIISVLSAGACDDVSMLLLVLLLRHEIILKYLFISNEMEMIY
jgi:hypothetical protein